MRDSSSAAESSPVDFTQQTRLTLLTGGSDRPYVFGLTTALLHRGLKLDLISSDELDDLGFVEEPNATVLNLRGSQRMDVSPVQKITRIARYYGKLVGYAARTNSEIFHILWNNKFEWFDRTCLMLYYRLLGKRVVLTAHNVNAAKRDGSDTLLNRATLKIQYHLSQNIFVHTQKMKQELCDEFAVPSTRVTVIPFGINNSIPTTDLGSAGAKQRLGLQQDERTILFFGRITPYKGLEYLLSAFDQLPRTGQKYRLIIGGRPDNCEQYWQEIQNRIHASNRRDDILIEANYIPDDQAERYFKAADVLVLPYKDIYQSGVLFLAQSFGLPVIAANVGSLEDDITEGETGFMFRPEDPVDLAKTIVRYFESDSYRNLGSLRNKIRQIATERHSWEVVSEITVGVYSRLLRSAGVNRRREVSDPSVPSADITASS